MTAVRQSLIVYLPHSMHPSLSFLTLYISVLSPVCCMFPMPHRSLPFARSLSHLQVPCLCLPLVSPIFILSLRQPYFAIPYFPYDSLPIIQITPILTTPHTCINTLVTSCCSPV